MSIFDDFIDFMKEEYGEKEDDHRYELDESDWDTFSKGGEDA